MLFVCAFWVIWRGVLLPKMDSTWNRILVESSGLLAEQLACAFGGLCVEMLLPKNGQHMEEAEGVKCGLSWEWKAAASSRKCTASAK